MVSTHVWVAPAPIATDRFRGRPLRPAAAAVAALGVCLLVNVVDPNEPGSFGTCPFLWATGLDCPGCGTLRALRAATRGDLALAADHNLLTLLLLPLLVAALVTWWQAERGTRPDVLRLPWLAPALALVVPVFWVARNLPWFAWLGAGAA